VSYPARTSERYGLTTTSAYILKQALSGDPWIGQDERMSREFPHEERWNLKMWSADWVVLYDWLSSVDLSTIPVEHKAAKQALADLMSNMEGNLDADVQSSTTEDIDRARHLVSKDMDWE
jgi:hypothetical protein